MTPRDIQNRLNLIAIQELKDHYNKSECYRILDDECESYKMAEALREDLVKDIEAMNLGVETKVTVNNIGVVNVYQVTEKTEHSKTLKELLTVRASISNMIPYAYVMGVKIGKRQMEAAVAEIERYL